jgi:hypothetical protein
MSGGGAEWGGSRQDVTAAGHSGRVSDCKAESWTVGVVVRHALCMQGVLQALRLDTHERPAGGDTHLQPLLVDCDNQGTIDVLNNT